MHKNKKIFVILLILVFLTKISNFIDSGSIIKNVQFDIKSASSCVIRADSSCNSIEAAPLDKRFWVGTLNFTPPVFPVTKVEINPAVYLLFCLFLIFDLRGNILKLIAIYFHGSKYKEGDLLSAF